ncbi:Protein-export membrane protein SecG [Rhodospirillaceae bacterium LM-1]|nr:Protein-export membrane protein SecG [Rhodospirillaceae bacterium LM-1]
MENVLLVIHLLLAIGLVGVILLQKSEGGVLGMGGGGGGFMTGRSAGNLLTRTTAILATGFILTSLALALIANGKRVDRSIMDQPAATQEAPAASPAPAKPVEPSAPVAR